MDATDRFAKVARPDAYPGLVHNDMTAPARVQAQARELELLEVCMQAIPGFVARHRQNDPTREEVTVSLGTEAVKLALSWVVQ